MSLNNNADTISDTSGISFESFFRKHDAIFLLMNGETGQLIDVNDAALRFYGYSMQQITSMKIGDINKLPPNELEAERQRALREERKCFIVPHLLANGAIRTVEVHTTPIVLSNKKYLFSVIHDITERKRAEEALQESEARYRSLFETSQDNIFIVDQKTGSFIAANDAACHLYGYTEDEFLRMKHSDVSAEPEKTKAAVRDSITRVPLRLHRKKDGTVFPVEIAGGYFMQGGRALHTAFIRDITDRKRAEAEKAKLETQNRQLQKAESLGRMAGAIAHHFNNQLGVVIGNLEMAIDVMPLGAGPIENLTTAMEASNRAAEMSGLMLTYLGQSFDTHELLDLSETCLQRLPILQAVMPKDMVLETDLPSQGPVISADANQIQQILTNLLINAWEAVGEEGGSIHLGVKTVSPADIPAAYRHPIDWQPQDTAYACLEVADAGCGIAAPDIEKLFDPFFSSKFTGRGMGLAVVMGIVRAHSGVVTVESEPGRGSTFRVFFPVSVEEVPRQPDKVGNDGDVLISTVSPIEMEGGGIVLLVEDEEMLRNMAAAMLTLLGFAVLEAKDGVEAVEVFRQRQNEISCILCDLTMPRMNGWETLTALRKLAPDIPVILTSGYDKAHVMAGDHPELPQVFLGKPYKLKGLRDAIGRAIGDGSGDPAYMAKGGINIGARP